MICLNTDTSRQDSIPKVRMEHPLGEVDLILLNIHTSWIQRGKQKVWYLVRAMLYKHALRHNVVFILSAIQCISPEGFSFH